MRGVMVGAAILAVAMSSGAIAREHKDGGAAPDPNKIVCKSEDSTGSRLARTKRCMKASDWAAEKATNQQDIERIQANRYKNQ